MIVDLKPIDSTNWYVACNLEVDPSQQDFISPNAVSLAQAHYEPWWIPLGVYDGDAMVGFVMHGCWPDQPVHPSHGAVTSGNDHILRVMLDKRQQGKGYGRAAMITLIERIKAQGNCAPSSCRSTRTTLWPRNSTPAWGLCEQATSSTTRLRCGWM